MLTYVLFVVGFILLIKGAEWLVDGGVSVAHHLKVSKIVVGLTIVSFGTSAPELFVNVVASFQDSPAIAIGNILGSNVANIFLILGVSSLIYPLAVKTNTIRRELPYSLLAIGLLAVLVNEQLVFSNPYHLLSTVDGMIMLAFFFLFMYYAYIISQDDFIEDPGVKVWSIPWSVVYIVLGLIGLAVGARWIVTGAVHTAKVFGVSESLIALTIVSIGTSLPELATSAVAAYKRRADIAVGNVVGSNIFNILWVLGLSSIIKALPFQPESNFDIGVNVLATVLLLIFVFMGRKNSIYRWQGGAFLLFYIAYIGALIYIEWYGVGWLY